MLKKNRNIPKNFPVLTRIAALVLPIVCFALLLTQVAFAKNTYLINDGGYVVIHTTYATDPEDVLDEAGLDLGEDDTYTTQDGIGMSEIIVQRNQLVTVVYGSTICTLGTYGETVEELLARMNIVLGEDDVVSVALNAETHDGMTIVISKTVSAEEIYTVTVPYETEYCYDPSLSEGEQAVLTQGCDGQIQYTDVVLYVNGCETSRTTQSQTVICEPVNQLIAIGTEVELPDYPQPTEPVAEETVPEETEPEETEPEETEPTVVVPETADKNEGPVIGDGYIVTADGEILTYTGTMQVVASAYNSADDGCDNYTATGTIARVGAIAVDPKVIPYGTRMFIVTNDGKYVYGIAVAEDCGGAIKGNRVDLYFDSVEECWTFGIRKATIYFLG